MIHSQEVLLNTNDLIKSMSRKQAIKFVQEVINQLNDAHGDSYTESDGFEFATLYFP